MGYRDDVVRRVAALESEFLELGRQAETLRAEGARRAPVAVAAFAVGDRVRCVRLPDYESDNLAVGDTGTVRKVDDDSVPYGVEWDRDIAGGHNLRGMLTSMRGWWVTADRIAPAPTPAPAADPLDLAHVANLLDLPAPQTPAAIIARLRDLYRQRHRMSDADPLDGLNAAVREGAQRVATRNGPTWLDCGGGWFVGWTEDASLEHPFVAIARNGVQFANLTVRDGRIAWDEAPDRARRPR